LIFNHTGHHSGVLGDLSDTLGYEQARDAALKWFRLFESGVTDDGYTVEAAFWDYVEDRRVERGEACAHDAEVRFRRTVYGTAFGRTPPGRFWTPDIQKWRRGIEKHYGHLVMSAARERLNAVNRL
jgi:hypothetical protein